VKVEKLHLIKDQYRFKVLIWLTKYKIDYAGDAKLSI
jgi:hypothetical protein